MYFSVQNFMDFGMGRKTAFLFKLSDAICYKDETVSRRGCSKKSGPYSYVFRAILFPDEPHCNGITTITSL